METLFNRFVFCLLLHLFAMEKVAQVPLLDPYADAYLTKTAKFG